MTSEERAVFSLMPEGERSTGVAAETMGIGELPPSEQSREVKRVKDRSKKRIRRRGIIQNMTGDMTRKDGFFWHPETLSTWVGT